MILELAHTKLTVYKVAGDLLVECYKLMNILPKDERFNLIKQVKRAALSVILNIAEGASRKSQSERKRFYEIARGSVIEIDTAIDVCLHLNYLTPDSIQSLGPLLTSSFKMLTKMTGKSGS